MSTAYVIQLDISQDLEPDDEDNLLIYNMIKYLKNNPKQFKMVLPNLYPSAGSNDIMHELIATR